MNNYKLIMWINKDIAKLSDYDDKSYTDFWVKNHLIPYLKETCDQENCLVCDGKERKLIMKRMWINQPSNLQEFHHLHGTNVLAMDEPYVNGTARIYFLSGSVISQNIPYNCLSNGWNVDKIR